MKNSLVLSLNIHELASILYNHFATTHVLDPTLYNQMAFTLMPDGLYRCEFFKSTDTPILNNNPNEAHTKKNTSRMIRLDDEEK